MSHDIISVIKTRDGTTFNEIQREISKAFLQALHSLLSPTFRETSVDGSGYALNQTKRIEKQIPNLKPFSCKFEHHTTYWALKVCNKMLYTNIPSTLAVNG
jgi:hypothetical protein